MLHNFGEYIRTHRKQKGLTLVELANKINVSTGYLSNLETGKTQTIQLNILEKITREFSSSENPSQLDQIDYRIQRIVTLLDELLKLKPKEAEFLMKTLEDGIDFFMDNKER